MTRRRAITFALIAAACIWTATVGAAFRAIRRFETTPGQAAIAPVSWPSASSIQRNPREWSLVMLVHPHCSCSRASVQELQAVIEKTPLLRSHVLVYRPDGAAEDWLKTEVVETATRLRRTRVMIDDEGREAERFGGFTSGQTFLYDPDGRLRFEGGITSLRGHAGINRGRTDIIQIVSSGSGRGAHPVFGCGITKSTAATEER
jgi:hypothetical protein